MTGKCLTLSNMKWYLCLLCQCLVIHFFISVSIILPIQTVSFLNEWSVNRCGNITDMSWHTIIHTHTHTPARTACNGHAKNGWADTFQFSFQWFINIFLQFFLLFDIAPDCAYTLQVQFLHPVLVKEGARYILNQKSISSLLFLYFSTI